MHAPIGEFVAAVRVLWTDYRRQGPDRVDASRWRAVEDAWQPLGDLTHDLPREILAAGARLQELCRQAAMRPEGLCFVTGEAGLVPRRDLHREFDQLLETISRYAVAE